MVDKPKAVPKVVEVIAEKISAPAPVYKIEEALDKNLIKSPLQREFAKKILENADENGEISKKAEDSLASKQNVYLWNKHFVQEGLFEFKRGSSSLFLVKAVKTETETLETLKINTNTEEYSQLVKMLSKISVIEPEKLIEAVKEALKTKADNSAKIAWEYLLDTVKTMINTPGNRISEYPVTKEMIIPIVEKLLEAIKISPDPEADKPLTGEEIDRFDAWIEGVSNNKNGDNAGGKMIQAVYCYEGDSGLPLDQIRKKAGLENFNGRYDEILAEKMEKGHITVVDSATMIKPINIRRILKTAKESDMPEKILSFLENKKNAKGDGIEKK